MKKRPVSLGELEKIADEIEQSLYNGMEKEVTSVHVGELVMDKLRALDEVAYVRFASVYRQFEDVNSFMKELRALIRDNRKQE